MIVWIDLWIQLSSIDDKELQVAMQSVQTFAFCHHTVREAAQQHNNTAALLLLRHSVEIQQAQSFFPL